MKIKKILIANRGEIAVRIAQTCRRMGIQTVGLFTPSERGFPHTLVMDNMIDLGEGKLSETYLNSEKIVQLAHGLKVDAIHPGHGFLSENAEFCREVNAHGIIFIGPDASVMELMGDKITSKKAMENFRVPLIPGYHGEDQTVERFKIEARRIGYPVMLKASAGGGGKGMRLVLKEEDLAENFILAKNEARKAFGPDELLLERYVSSPRHIEVQVISDHFGNHLHLFERECSIQRRHQKIIEETPGPSVSNSLRQNVCQCAVEIARHIGYVGAGTVEFMADEKDQFYFLEMNTRLQVEHTVTEEVTGVDLVELQIRVASGERLDKEGPKEVINPIQKGHAIEVRIYAEDPDKNYLPTSGTVFGMPMIMARASADPSPIRVDSGICTGNKVNLNFDPMLVKIIGKGEDRNEAIAVLLKALDQYVPAGIKTNRSFLKRILSLPAFQDETYDTHFLEKQKNNLKIDDPLIRLAKAVAVALCAQSKGSESKIQTAWTKNLLLKKLGTNKQLVNYDDEQYQIQVCSINSTEVKFKLDEDSYSFHVNWKELVVIDQNTCEKEKFRCERLANYDRWHVFLFNEDFILHFNRYQEKSGPYEKSLILSSPMPGKVNKILVQKGQKIEAGTAILIVEAMKMENLLKAAHDAEIEEILTQEGDQVASGQILVVFKGI